MAHALRLGPMRGPPGTRFAAFALASVALHALTLGLYVPGGGSGRSSSPPGTVLHAVLAPREAPASTPAPAAEPAPPAAPEPIAGAEPAGAGGLDMPLPDKWYTAAEVDVRAEQLTRENLDYPLELSGSGMKASVRVRLFIDERGKVRKVELAQVAPHRAFDIAARKAWEHVSFSPALKDGAPVKSQKLLEVAFEPEDLPKR